MKTRETKFQEEKWTTVYKIAHRTKKISKTALVSLFDQKAVCRYLS